MEIETKKNEVEEENEIKQKNIKFMSNKAKNYLINLISHLMINKNNFEEKIKPSELEFKLETNSDISYINQLIYKLEINYNSFNTKRDIVKNIKKYKDYPSEIKVNDEYYLTKSIFQIVNLNFFPIIRKGINLDLSFFPIYSYNNKNKKINKYNFQINNNNTDNKFILCLYVFQNDEIAINKIDKIIENLNLTYKIWEYFKNIYVFFQLKNDEQIIRLVENEKIKKYIDSDNKNENKIVYLFNILKNYGKPNNMINIFEDKNKKDKDNYFFILDQKNNVIKLKNISHIFDTISYFLFNLKNNNSYHSKEKMINKPIKFLKTLELMNFILKLKNLDYIFDINFNISINVSINDELSEIKLKKLNSIKVAGEFCKKEYKYLLELFNSIKQKDCKFNAIEIPTIDIDIDFTEMICHNCSKEIPEDSFLYYCYICKHKYCFDCVQNQLKNNGKEKYIDQNHNLLFFKTRDKNLFLNLDKSKIGNNKFAESVDDNDFDNKHDAQCSGCHTNLVGTERYICVKCKKGLIIGNGFIDYCGKCIDKMCKDKKDMEKLEIEANGIINKTDSNTFTSDHKIKIEHKHESHIYLMLPLQYKHDEDPYFNF